MEGESARSIFYPGTISERKRYIALRFVPPIVTFVWLLIPLIQPSCGDKAENLYTFLFLYFLFYLVISVCVAWSIFDVVVGIPRDKKKLVLGVSALVVFLPIFVLLLIGWSDLEDHKWSYDIPSAVLIGAIPILIFFVYYSRKKTRESFYEAASSATEEKITDTDPVELSALEVTVTTPTHQPINYVNRMVWLTIVLVFFLIIFFLCVIFSILYEKYTEEYSGKGNYIVQFFTVVFTIMMAILKAIMNVLSDKLDLSMGNGKFRMTRALFGYVTDLFNFMFYRSLFLNISRYEIFVGSSLLSAVVTVVIFPVKASRLFFTFLFRLIDRITFDKNNTATEENFIIYKEEVVMEFFFSVVAEFISLFTFTVCFAFLYYGYNSPFFHFPSAIMGYNETYNLSNAAVFITYLPITLFFEAIYVILLRIYFKRLIGKDAFQVGMKFPLEFLVDIFDRSSILK